jgi:hypothetical protein
MKWLWNSIASLIVGGGVVSYVTGFDEIIYRTIMNFGASIFMYILIKVIELFTWLFDMLPPLPNVGYYSGSIMTFLRIVVMGNTFFPVMELLSMVAFAVVFISLFFLVKIILKLIPTIG